MYRTRVIQQISQAHQDTAKDNSNKVAWSVLLLLHKKGMLANLNLTV